MPYKTISSNGAPLATIHASRGCVRLHSIFGVAVPCFISDFVFTVHSPGYHAYTKTKSPPSGLFCCFAACILSARTKKEPVPALFSDITARLGRLRNAFDCIVRGTNLWPRRVFVCVYSILSSCPLVKLRPLFFCQRRQPPPSASACKRVCAVNSHTSRQSNVLNTEVPVTIKQSFFTSKAGRRGVRRPAVSAGSFCQAP